MKEVIINSKDGVKFRLGLSAHSEWIKQRAGREKSAQQEDVADKYSQFIVQ
jgi:hypothetical protein